MKPVLGRSGKTDDKVNVTDSMTVEDTIRLAIARVNQVVNQYHPVWVSAGLSGGHDSITATWIASRSAHFKSALHINTGVGLQATEDFVKRLCAGPGWPLEVFSAMENVRWDGTPDPMDYFALCEEHGFPGPGQHGTQYIKLKQRQIGRFCAAHKRRFSKELVMIVSGARRQESPRRTSKEQSDVSLFRRDESYSVLWCNPLFDFSKLDCSRIMKHAGLPRSPVVDLIHKSGECLCGAFGSQAELKETAFWFPKDPTILRIQEMEPRLRCKFGWGWGERPDRKAAKTGPMCSSCQLAIPGIP